MKKTLGVVAAVALSAMPVVGVFAADSLNPITDTVTVTIDSACSLSTAASGNAGASITKGMTNNSLETDLAGSVFTIKCNDAGGWHLSAIGAGENTDKTQMKPSKTGSTAIATGTTTGTGNPSSWAFKVTGKSGADKTVAGYRSYSQIPSGATDVALDTTSAVGQAGTTVSAFYQVWIGDTQQADTYVGKVTYTLAHPQS